MKLEYGLPFVCHLSRKDNIDKIDEVICTVERYWNTDTDPNKYKIKLVPLNSKDKEDYESETFYSVDFLSLVRQGIIREATIEELGYDETLFDYFDDVNEKRAIKYFEDKNTK